MPATEARGDPSTLDVALRLAKSGFAVFAAHGIRRTPAGPVCGCGDADCRAPGKAPFESFTTWPQDLPLTHPLEIEGRWRVATARMCRDGGRYVEPNIGIATGHPHGYVVIDVDPKDDGYTTLFGLERTVGALPDTLAVVTGSGGRHLYYKTDFRPLKGGRAGLLGPGIDVKAHHAYVIGPGSMHKSGNRYYWAPGYGPGEIEMATLPEAWFEAIHTKSMAGTSGYVPATTYAAHSRLGLIEAKIAASAFVGLPAWAWAKENPDDVSRPTWLGFASNLAAVIDGHPALVEPARRMFHKLSTHYTGYSRSETDRVFDGAMTWIYKQGRPPARWSSMVDVPMELRGDSTNMATDARRKTRSVT